MPPILNYHKIEPRTDFGITTRRPQDFSSDMELLAGNGYTTQTFRDLETGTDTGKTVILTFDDGYASVYETALPIMQRFGFKGVIFIPTDYIGRTNLWDVQFAGKVYRHLNRSQLKELSDAGFEIAAHGCSHRPFTNLSDAELQRELQHPRRLLQDLTGQAVDTVCYPFGRFDRRVLSAVKKAGYRRAVASLYLKACPPGEANLALRRFNIYRFETQAAVKTKLQGDYNSLLAYRDWLIQLGGRATGVYQKLKIRRSDDRKTD